MPKLEHALFRNPRNVGREKRLYIIDFALLSKNG